MRRYLIAVFGLLLFAGIGFGFGLNAGVRKTPAFEFVVKTVRLLRPKEIVATAPSLQLDMSDRTLLDSTVLPLHQAEILVTEADGRPMPLLAVAKSGGSEAVVLAANGTMFRLDVENCATLDCLRQVGRLVRPDGTKLDDIYDILSVEIDGQREWFVSYGQEDRTGFTKALAISRFDPPAEAGTTPFTGSNRRFSSPPASRCGKAIRRARPVGPWFTTRKPTS